MTSEKLKVFSKTLMYPVIDCIMTLPTPPPTSPKIHYVELFGDRAFKKVIKIKLN